MPGAVILLLPLRLPSTRISVLPNKGPIGFDKEKIDRGEPGKLDLMAVFVHSLRDEAGSDKLRLDIFSVSRDIFTDAWTGTLIVSQKRAES